MFKKTKIRIVVVIMSVLILLFAGTLFLIYYSSYTEVNERNKDMLGRYAKEYWQNGNPEGLLDEPPFPDGEKGEDNSPGYSVSTFCSVEFSKDGNVINIDNKNEAGTSDEYLISLCRSLLDQGEGYATKDNWIYYLEKHNNSTVIVLMNNVVMNDTVLTLFQNTILYGSITIFLLILLSTYLAHRIVQPLERNAEKQKQFISDASHELKTPIAVIATNAELLERELGENKWLNNIKDVNQNMGELVHQLLDLARTENTIPKMTKLDFSRIVMGSILPFECLAFENDQELQMFIPDNIHVVGNEEQLKKVISILIENALEHSPQKRKITVTLKVEHNRVVLLVINEGEIISEEQKRLLFERFYQCDSGRNNGHYGLGLAIAKAIVTAHHGKITVTCNHNQVIFVTSLPTCSQKIQ